MSRRGKGWVGEGWGGVGSLWERHQTLTENLSLPEVQIITNKHNKEARKKAREGGNLKWISILKRESSKQ